MGYFDTTNKMLMITRDVGRSVVASHKKGLRPKRVMRPCGEAAHITLCHSNP
jgi:hypothetical protein